MPDPTLCRTGCGSWECHQGRNLPCPHRAADVAAMREMGIDLQPIERTEDPGPGWWQWMQRHRGWIAAALVAACWGVSSVLPMGWAT